MNCSTPVHVHHQLPELTQTCPLSRWCHPAISSSVIPFSSCLQSFLASGSFQMSHFLASGGQSIGVSPSTSVLAMNIQDWFPLGWTGWISLQSEGLSRVFQHHSSKASILLRSAFFMVQLSHPYMTTGETIALTRRTFVGKVMSLLLNMLSRLVIGEGNGTPLQYSCLENPMDVGAWWAAVYRVTWSWTRLSAFTFMHWKRKWQPTPVFLPGESQGWGSLVGCRLWGCTESDTT